MQCSVTEFDATLAAGPSHCLWQDPHVTHKLLALVAQADRLPTTQVPLITVSCPGMCILVCTYVLGQHTHGGFAGPCPSAETGVRLLGQIKECQSTTNKRCGVGTVTHSSQPDPVQSACLRESHVCLAGAHHAAASAPKPRRATATCFMPHKHRVAIRPGKSQLMK